MTSYRCPHCTSEYTSSWAAGQCEEECAEEQLHAVQALRGRSK